MAGKAAVGGCNFRLSSGLGPTTALGLARASPAASVPTFSSFLSLEVSIYARGLCLQQEAPLLAAALLDDRQLHARQPPEL